MESIWEKTRAQRPAFLSDEEDFPTSCEVAVIGGGMAGILTAYMLTEAGVDTVVFEAKTVASGQTQNTTAKITAQHGLIYHTLMEQEGRERAALYAKANQTAVYEYKKLIEKEKISCDFEPRRAYVYKEHRLCPSSEDLMTDELLEKEVKAALSLGLAAFYENNLSLPFPASGVGMENQAQFHPLKFIYGISGRLKVWEHTKVISVEKDRLVTDRGEVSAKHIVFACHYPFINVPGYFFARMYQERSYVLALGGASLPDGMYIGSDSPSYSLRKYQNMVLLGGGGHRTGENASGGRYEELKRKAEELFPGSREIARWSAQDCITPDQIPYIGRYSLKTPNWYVATGFMKWGMSTSMVAARLLSDLILERENPFADVFAPSRWETKKVSMLFTQGMEGVKGISRQLFSIPEETARQLPLGQGGTVLLNGEKTGIYKDEEGKLYGVSLRCPHLGCQLEWNPDEKTWDCPCHGSRFDYSGHLIDGPAQEDIDHE